ncbi:Aldo/keto reductase [Streptomyces zhaozhouensis]|uniref:Aldo/keto reductase n=1 Tax=Streptomyces zhaozhouensis TaxID=1300267 RepID=A0A286DUJ0_9ACTN|nr:aldo/keto reductase [Streptomyces zhaozhouensis]SOD62337.1 Aldo/keto reductase [Streptomyces zhaozhouensis]
MSAAPHHTLNDDHALPAVGFGTYPLDDAEAERSVADAIGQGYRLIDTAVNYRNETGVGRGIAAAGVPREELVVTTKLPGRHHGYEETLASFEESRNRLGLSYVDLYLIHWPNPSVDRYVDTWRAMAKLREDGLVRSVGVSNFTPAQLTRLREETGVVPAVNQIELHPLLPQEEARAFHAREGIVTESWSPLGRGSTLLEDGRIGEIARAHGVGPAQVILRWHLQLAAVPIPKSADPERRRGNIDIFGFSLDAEEMAAVADRPHRRLGGDPDHHEEM